LVVAGVALRAAVKLKLLRSSVPSLVVLPTPCAVYEPLPQPEALKSSAP